MDHLVFYLIRCIFQNYYLFYKFLHNLYLIYHFLSLSFMFSIVLYGPLDYRHRKPIGPSNKVGRACTLNRPSVDRPHRRNNPSRGNISRSTTQMKQSIKGNIGQSATQMKQSIKENIGRSTTYETFHWSKYKSLKRTTGQSVAQIKCVSLLKTVKSQR